jgi:hypothetical protein
VETLAPSPHREEEEEEGTRGTAELREAGVLTCLLRKSNTLVRSAAASPDALAVDFATDFFLRRLFICFSTVANVINFQTIKGN